MNIRSRLIERGWDRYARLYDSLQPRVVRLFRFFGRFSFEEFQQQLVDLAGLRPGDRVLDVACGTGASHQAILEKIGKRGKLIGADISTEMLNRAKEKARAHGLENVQYRKADAQELSAVFGKEEFDAVISVNGLPQFLHPDKALIEMVYVLKPGGTLALSTINRDRCEKSAFYWPLMQMAPRLWHTERFRRRLQELGMEQIKTVEEGLMLIIVAVKGRA